MNTPNRSSGAATSGIISMLSEKVDQVREDLSARLDRQDLKLEAIHDWMLKNPQCPSPGACIGLTNEMRAGLIRVQKLEERILLIEKWQSRIMGGGAVLITLVTLFGPSLRRVFNLE